MTQVVLLHAVIAVALWAVPGSAQDDYQIVLNLEISKSDFTNKR